MWCCQRTEAAGVALGVPLGAPLSAPADPSDLLEVLIHQGLSCVVASSGSSLSPPLLQTEPIHVVPLMPFRRDM